MKIKLIFSLILIQISFKCFVNSVIVDTGLGQIKGNELFIKEHNKSVSVFQAIPFAKPPIGDLRFKKAQPIDKWDGVWDGTQPRSSCMQPNEDNINENCLFLNIYVPHTKFDNNTRQLKRSVMLWIYGGAFITGTIFDGSFNSTYLSLLGDVIVVQPNYRLSAFGFLYDGTDEAPGNQAFTDLLTALEFVKKNIEYFGGDPNSVTIFGESAGSMSVSALILMKNRNLFHRAIMQSGSVDSYLGSEPKESALIKAEKISKHFKCFDITYNKINISCLRAIDSKSIVSFVDTMRYSAEFFAPIFGDQLLPVKPSIALANGNYNKDIDLLFGTCKDEGAGFMSSTIGIKDMRTDSPDNSMSVAKAKLFIQLVFSSLRIPFAQQVSDFYTKGLTDADGLKLKHAVADAFGDYQLTCPTIEFGETIAQKGRAYAYRLTFSTRKDWTGVQHGDDIRYVFGAPLRHPNDYNDSEKQLSLTFNQIWTTFAKTGKPSKVNGIQWPEAVDRSQTNSSVRYLALNPKDYEIVENVYKNSCDGFWKSHLNQRVFKSIRNN